MTHKILGGASEAFASLHSPLNSEHDPANSVCDMMKRSTGFQTRKEVTVSAGVGSHVVNFFKVTGSVWILEQWAVITEVTDLTNCTAVYSTFYDGTNTVQITADGSVLSGLSVGSAFSKLQDETQTYTVIDASQARITVPGSIKKQAYPFVLTQKNGVDSFLRLHLSTTSGVNFKIMTMFDWAPINGGNLEILV